MFYKSSIPWKIGPIVQCPVPVQLFLLPPRGTSIDHQATVPPTGFLRMKSGNLGLNLQQEIQIKMIRCAPITTQTQQLS